MSPGDPIQALADQLRALVQPDGSLPIEPDTLGSASIQGLFSDFLNDSPLTIEAAQVTIPVGLPFVQVFGTGDDSSEPFGGLAIDARFTWSQEKAEYELTLFATAPPGLTGWTLGNAFAQFKADEPLGFTPIDAPAFTLSSAGDFSAPVGLTFAGDVLFQGSVTLPLITLFPGQDQIQVAGAVEKVTGGVPFFQFSGEGTNPITIGGGLFSITPSLTVQNDTPAGGGAPVATVYAGWDLDSGGSAGPLAIRAAWPFDDPTLQFQADVSQTESFLFGALSNLAGGTDFGPILPTQLPIPGQLTLKIWTLEINPSDYSLASFSLLAGTTESWPIVSSISLDNLNFEFLLDATTGPGLVLSAIFTLDEPTNTTLKLFASAPSFAFGGDLQSTNGIDLHTLIAKLSTDAAALIPDGLTLNELSLSVDPSNAAYQFETSVGNSQWQLTFEVAGQPFEFDLANITLKAASKAGVFTAEGETTLTLGSSADAPVITLGVVYSSKKGWTFSGELDGLTFDQLLNVLATYFPTLAGILKAADLNLVARTLSVELSKDPENPGYEFNADVLWTLDVGGSEPLQIEAVLNADSSVEDGQTLTLAGTFRYGDSLALNIQISFEENWKIEFFWKDFHATYEKPKATFSFGNQSLGTMVDALVDAVVPGQSFSLVSPWDLLNSLPLGGLQVILDFEAKTVSFSTAVPSFANNFGFVSIDTIEMTCDFSQPKPPVTFSIPSGQFLGQPISSQYPVTWNVLDPGGTKPVPGFGNQLLRIDFLAIGQRFAPSQPLDTTTVETALGGIEKAFQIPPGEAGTQLVYSPATNWIVALEAELFSGSIWIGALFLDPELYGVALRVAPAGRFPQLGNLHFEILYKKIGDNLGVYQGEITLPDTIRTIDFGSLAITLPTFKIWIYTNGDFKVDFGFPEDGNFSQSFAVQMLPFIGAGGFYFGVLDSSTATDLPQTNHLGQPIPGSFHPVIVFGLGAAIGLGRTIDYSIVKGGLSLLLQGIVEGVFATYNPWDATTESGLYWSIDGKVALVGRIFGSVDFAIIVARFDVTITLAVTLGIAVGQPIQFAFEASVSVSASISINLGLFSVTIGFSFTLSVSDQFTIGSPSSVPWDPNALAAGAQRLRGISLSDSSCPGVPLKWAPVDSDEEVQLWLVPHLTTASAVDGQGNLQPARAQMVAMLYIERAAPGTVPPAAVSPFSTLAQGILLWVINAALNGAETPKATLLGQTVTHDLMQQVFCTLTNDGGSLFVLDDLAKLFEKYLHFTVSQRTASGEADDGDITVSVFPVVPPMSLQVMAGTPLEFSGYNPVSPEELQAIVQILKQLQPDPDGGGSKARATARLGGDSLSLATFLFLDYFGLLCKGTVQAAIQALKKPTVTPGDGDSLLQIAGEAAAPLAVARANRTRRLRPGLALRIPNGARRAAGSACTVGDGTAETLLGIARRHGTTAEELALANLTVPGLFAPGEKVLLPADGMRVGDLLQALQDQGEFDNLAGQVARVLLAGLRPPWPAPGSATQALYAITGQQFDVSAFETGDSFTLAVPELSWIDFGKAGGTAVLSTTVTISADEKTLIGEMNGATLAPAFTSGIQPFSGKVAKRFTLAAAVSWTVGGGARLAHGPGGAAVTVGDGTQLSIWQLPADLLKLTATWPGLLPAVSLQEETRDAPGLLPYALAGLVDDTSYSWATSFSVEITRIPSAADPSVVLPNTYNLAGTDQVGGALLQQLLLENVTDPVGIDQIYLLFPLEPGTALPAAGVKSDPVTGTSYFVLQTNLSTASNPPSAAVAARTPDDTPVPPVAMTFLDMLRLIWECSVVRSGGYQLFYDHNGNGLPDFLFAKDGRAEPTVLVTYSAQDGRVHSFYNALVASQPVDPQSVFYLEVIGDPATLPSQLVEIAPAMTAGHAGFEARRTFQAPERWQRGTALRREQAESLVDQQFQLLEYRLHGGDGFKDSPDGLPVSPATPPGDPQSTEGDYAAVLPIAGFALDPGVDTGLAGAPPPASDPYRGIGTTVQVALAWHDLFGNVCTTADPGADSGGLYAPSAEVLYFDSLIPLSSWPGLALSYRVEPDPTSKAPTLYADIVGDSSRYDPAQAGDAWRTVAQTDQARYAAVYYQIARNVRITLGSSLDPTLAADVTAPLLAFVVQMYAYLTQILASGYSAADNRVTLSAPVADSGAQALFALTAGVTIQRLTLVDPTAGADASAVTTSLSPKLAPPSGSRADDDSPSTLTLFAQNLQACFPALMLAAGTPDSTTGTEQAWAMRFGPGGYACSFQDPCYLSLLPLALAPLSLNGVTLHTYDGTQPIPLSPTLQKSFDNVDLDLLARGFFDAMDLVLSPDYGVKAWNLVPGIEPPPEQNPVTGILLAKQTLAAKVSSRVDTPEASRYPAPAAWVAAASARLEQELLIRLASAYQIDALVTLAAAVTGPDGDPSTAPRLYGKVVQSGTGTATDDRYALSTATIPLSAPAGSSFLTFTFSTTDKQSASLIELPVELRVSHLEHDFQPMPPPIEGYTASSWLSFVLPFDKASDVVRQAVSGAVGQLQIPIPLKASPTPPSLADQSAAGYEPQDGNVETTRLWKYSFTYDYAGASQDDVHVRINFQDPAGRAALTDGADLPAALLQFSTTWPAIFADFQGTDSGRTVNALLSFAWIAGQIAAAWPTAGSLTPIEAADDDPLLEFVISQQPVTVGDTAGALELTATSPGGGFPPARVRIDNYRANGTDGTYTYTLDIDTGPPVYLGYEQALAIPRRYVDMAADDAPPSAVFDLLTRQQAWGAISIARNEVYTSASGTQVAGSAGFIYRTPYVRAVTPAVPLLAPDVPINMAPTPEKRTLEVFLQEFLTALLLPAGAAQAVARVLQISCSFQYSLGQGVALPVDVPILLTVPAVLDPDSAVVAAAAGQILAWMEASQAFDIPGQLLFTVAMFNDATAAAVPVLKLNDIYLDTSLIERAAPRDSRA